MKVCQLCAVDFTLRHFLLPLMTALREAGHEVVGVAADGAHLAPVREAGFRVETAPIRRSYDLIAHWRAYRALRALFERERFDLIHVHTPVAGLIGRFAAWRAGVPLVAYTAHGFYFHDRMAAPLRLFHILLEWLGGRVTDILLTQAAEDAETARRWRLCRGGVVAAIGNGVDPARFAPAEPAARRRIRSTLDTPEGAVVIVVIGRLVAEKGYPELFQAVAGLDAYLWVVGERLDSDHAPSIDAALADLENDPERAERVRLLGYRDDVPALLAAADLFVLPSHREGMPRSIIEAMMSGLPVVATDIRGAREEVVDGATGLLVPVGDVDALAAALGRLAADPDLRHQMGAAGQARAHERYDEKKVIARQLDLLGLARSPDGS